IIVTTPSYRRFDRSAIISTDSAAISDCSAASIRKFVQAFAIRIHVSTAPCRITRSSGRFRKSNPIVASGASILAVTSPLSRKADTYSKVDSIVTIGRILTTETNPITGRIDTTALDDTTDKSVHLRVIVTNLKKPIFVTSRITVSADKTVTIDTLGKNGITDKSVIFAVFVATMMI